MDDLTIWRGDSFVLEQARDFRVPGYLILATSGAETRLQDFSAAATAEMAEGLRRAEAILEETLRPGRVYFLRFGEAVPRIHFHVVARTDNLLAAYVRETEDREPVSGARLMDWIWRRHESLGFTPEDVRAFVEAARKAAAGR